jgi:hypothetical protein
MNAFHFIDRARARAVSLIPRSMDSRWSRAL